MTTLLHPIVMPGPRQAQKLARRRAFAVTGTRITDTEIERILRSTSTRAWQESYLGWLDELRTETNDVLPEAPISVFDSCPMCGLSRPDIRPVAHGYYAECRGVHTGKCGFRVGEPTDPFTRLADLYEHWHRGRG